MHVKRARFSSLSTLQRSKTNQQPSAWPRLLKQRYCSIKKFCNLEKEEILFCMILLRGRDFCTGNDEMKIVFQNSRFGFLKMSRVALSCRFMANSWILKYHLIELGIISIISRTEKNQFMLPKSIENRTRRRPEFFLEDGFLRSSIAEVSLAAVWIFLVISSTSPKTGSSRSSSSKKRGYSLLCQTVTVAVTVTVLDIWMTVDDSSKQWQYLVDYPVSNWNVVK